MLLSGRVGRNDVCNLGYEGNLDILWFGWTSHITLGEVCLGRLKGWRTLCAVAPRERRQNKFDFGY